MLERFYLNSESILLDKVIPSELWGYIYNGFALVEIFGEKVYMSYNFDKPDFILKATQEVDNAMVSNSDGLVIASLIKMATKIKTAQCHFGDTTESWVKIEKEFSKDEYKQTIENYRNTINSLICAMLPNCAYRV